MTYLWDIPYFSMFKWHLEEYTSTSNIHAIFYQTFDNGLTVNDIFPLMIYNQPH